MRRVANPTSYRLTPECHRLIALASWLSVGLGRSSRRPDVFEAAMRDHVRALEDAYRRSGLDPEPWRRQHAESGVGAPAYASYRPFGR